MAEPHVISALCTKRAEISGYIADLECKINRQRAVLANVDANNSVILPRHKSRRHSAKAGLSADSVLCPQ